MEDIKEWVKNNHGSGTGYGYGSGFGYGAGYGFGYGAGNGYGSGSGYGNGNGNGNGYKINGDYVYNIDNINTVIKVVKGQIAKGFIVNNDLILSKTFIVKDADSKYFAHGKTIKEAFEYLEKKSLLI